MATQAGELGKRGRLAFEVLEHDAVERADWAGHVRPGGWLMLSDPAGLAGTR